MRCAMRLMLQERRRNEQGSYCLAYDRYGHVDDAQGHRRRRESAQPIDRARHQEITGGYVISIVHPMPAPGLAVRADT